jgi:UDP-N-acetyl-2-amino-2-deoxyglucuronate dehydrogenase
MLAVKETGNEVIAALDPSDSVGAIDRYFPDAHFFTEFERFDRYIDKLRRQGAGVDFVSICSPNHLHDAHIRFALRSNAHAICEKPLVINPWNLDGLSQVEAETGRRVYNILQLRLHPEIQELHRRVTASPAHKVFDVELTYVTSRGRWYAVSWKGDASRSGGIVTNIGIHLFDVLGWIFGDRRKCRVHIHRDDAAAGVLDFERARVCWFLSTNPAFLPNAARVDNKRAFRNIKVDGAEVEFSNGLTNLHTASYVEILSGRGLGIKDARAAIDTAYEIRVAAPLGLNGDYHPLAKVAACC